MNEQLIESPLLGQNLARTFLTPTKAFRRLSILVGIDKLAQVSQHRLARATGLSAAMVNTYLKSMVAAGLVQRTPRNNRDMRYQLTTAGRQERAALFSRYAATVVQLYTHAKHEIARQLATALSTAGNRLILYGASETCELTLQALRNFPQTTIAAIVDSDPDKQGQDFHGHIVQPPGVIPHLAADLLLITSFACQEEIYRAVRHLEDHGLTIKRLAEI